MAARRCIACDASGPFPVLFERFGYTVVRCDCGLAFQDPQPSADVLADSYYQDEGFARALLGELRETTLDSARRKLELLRDAGAWRPGIRVLDVGASSGAWLEVGAAAGADAVGVELGESTAAAARDRGLDVRTGTLAGVLDGLAGERFDLITFWDVLEHLPDPRHELELSRSLLAPGGRVAATYPNVDGLYPTLTYRLLARRTGIWEHPELPVHLFDLSPRSSRLLLERQGYDIERIRTFAIPFEHLRTTVLAPGRTGAGWRGRTLRAAFAAIHLAAYPVAKITDRGNAMFVLARAAEVQRGRWQRGDAGSGEARLG